MKRPAASRGRGGKGRGRGKASKVKGGDQEEGEDSRPVGSAPPDEPMEDDETPKVVPKSEGKEKAGEPKEKVVKAKAKAKMKAKAKAKVVVTPKKAKTTPNKKSAKSPKDIGPKLKMPNPFKV